MNIERTDTAAQRAAIEANDDFIAVIAGPGAGKTRVLVERIRRLIKDGFPAAKIIAITYTNAAAKEIETRLKEIFGANFALGYVGTLHGFALRSLRRYGKAMGYGDKTAVIDEDASASLIESKAKANGCKTPIKQLIELKKKGRKSGEVARTVDEIVVAAYFDELRESGLVDLDAILPEFAALIAAGRFPKDEYDHILWDEFQDAAPIDDAILDTLPIKNRFVVADPDQSVFGFRGGDVKCFLKLLGYEDVRTITLSDNFRCGVNICESANDLISRNLLRTEKVTNSATGHPGMVRFIDALNSGEEIAMIADLYKMATADLGLDMSSCAIIARTNAIADAFRDGLAAVGIPVQRKANPDLPPDWAFVRSFIELLANPENDTLAFFHMVQMKVRAGKSKEEALKAAHEARRGSNGMGDSLNAAWLFYRRPDSAAELPQLLMKANVSLESRMTVGKLIRDLPERSTVDDIAFACAKLERDRRDKMPEEEEGSKGIVCTTAHAAKGREWDHVIIVGCEEEVWPGRAGRCGPVEQCEEERRLMYVAVTRARKTVTLSWASSREASWGDNRPMPRSPSRFLEELKGGVS